jgi:WD40 repeat protein
MLQVFATPIRSHALHAYHSAFVTMPRCLLLDTVSHKTPAGRLPRLISPRAAYWGPSPRVLEGHEGYVRSVAFSPDGKHIVSGSSDCTVRVWNAVTFEHLAQLEGHEGYVRFVAFSPDGKHIVSCSDDRTVRVWNAVTFEQLAQLEGHEGYVRFVAFSPDGKHIVSGSSDCTVRVWNAVTFEQLAQLDGHEDDVNSVAFSPDGKHIVSSSDDRTVRVWNAVTFEQLAQLQGHEEWVTSVAFSPDSQVILSRGWKGEQRAWKYQNSEHSAYLYARVFHCADLQCSCMDRAISSGLGRMLCRHPGYGSLAVTNRLAHLLAWGRTHFSVASSRAAWCYLGTVRKASCNRW